MNFENAFPTRALTIAVAASLVPFAAQAHHSRQEFALDVEVMEGVLESVNWTNPHPTFDMTVTGEGGAEPCFNESAEAGGQAHWAASDEDVVDAAAENLGLFRVWSQPHRSAGTTALEGAISIHLPWNEAALARRAATRFEPRQDGAVRLSARGLYAPGREAAPPTATNYSATESQITPA